MVVAVAVAGGFIGAQFFFWLGHRYGNRILARFPAIAAKAPKVQELLRRWDAPVIMVIRFLYGLRIAGPIVIGSAGIARWRLMLFNFLGALIWAPLVAGVGFVAGEAMEHVFKHAHHIQYLVLIAIAAIIGLIYLLRRRRR